MNQTLRDELELMLLRALISSAGLSQPVAGNSRMQAVFGLLVDYTWCSEEHAVVFRCLRTAQRVRGAPLRHAMAAEATRMGHPDADWDSYFQEPEGPIDLNELIRRLVHKIG
jgi:hypothetical protein